jgi:hypothetical protein
MAQASKQSRSGMTLWQHEAREFRLLYWVSFFIFLVAAAVSRVLPGQRNGGFTGVVSVRRSVIAEARASAQTLIPFAFMK